MRWMSTLAAVVLAMALLMPASPAQVRSASAPDGQQPSGRSATVAARAGVHQGVMPTPIGVSPAPAPAFPTPTPIGVPPLLPVPGVTNPGFNDGFHHHHHHPDGFFGGAYPVYVPVPVAVDPYSMYQASPDQVDQETEDQSSGDQAVVPGPTVFERRSPGEMMTENSDPASAAVDPAPVPAAQPDSSAANQLAQPQESSLLVFRDGHQLEVQNYAIVGDVLYDFTPGHARKVPLLQLDLTATIKANDDRGVDFVLPASARNE